MKKALIALVAALLWVGTAKAQNGFDQTPQPSNYVLSRSGWVSPVTSTGGLTNFGVSSVPNCMTSNVATPTTTPALTLAFSNFNPFYIYGNTSASAGAPNCLDFSTFMGHFNGVIYANDAAYAGTDMGASIANALAAAYASGGGTVDARGFVCPANCHIGTADLTVGDGTHPVILLLPAGTITRDTVSGLGRSAQITYNSNATMIGAGVGATSISGPSDVTAMQQANNVAGVSGAHLSGFSVKDTGTVTAGSVALMIGGPNADGTRGQDVLSSVFENINASGGDIGVLADSQHGCICYNKLINVNPTGASIGLKTMNDSGFDFGFNSNQIYMGNYAGPVGLLDTGGVRNLYVQPDFENNSNASGTIKAVQAQDVGTGYVVGDIVTATDGCTTNPTLKVNTIGTGGAVGAQGHPGLLVQTAGSGCPAIAKTVATTGGTGTGLTVNLETSGFMVLYASGSLVLNQYEEAGSGDFICGIGNTIIGAFFSGNGANYTPTYCDAVVGSDPRYTSPDSNMIFGSGAQPKWLSMSKGIVLGSGYSYNPGGSFTKANWSFGSGAPSGSCASGSLYTNTSGGAGTTLYVCESGSWVAK